MRRGHPGIGGWRNENPRHFRPRSGGTPHFRPPRNFPLLENPRFPPPGPRPHRVPQPYGTYSRNINNHGPPEHYDRNKYRGGIHQNNPRLQDRSHHSQQRQYIPFYQQKTRHNNSTDHNSPYKEQNYYEDITIDQAHVNSMGDVDHRQLGNQSRKHEPYGHKQHPISPWVNSPYDSKKHYYADRSPQKSYRHHDPIEGNKIPVLDYTGHRPPSSDHYGATPGPLVNDNNTSFSRSVDDTVDIVRKRLLNRNEPQRLSQDTPATQSHDSQESDTVSQQIPQEQPVKKRIQKQPIEKSNCDKMKTKIVHQLFKMDKDKMHKLMDNPSSSTKFEYAISSLITESQNSLNRHLRSVAEKSLYSSSTDFINNDNNTIYEDTFMKQMQCLLDPQDTVLLEDIKPIVMAELSKVLQLNDFEHIYEGVEYQGSRCPSDGQPNFSYYDSYPYEEYPQSRFYEQGRKTNHDNLERLSEVSQDYDHEQQIEYTETKPLFERRPAKTPEHSTDRRQSFDSQRHRRSIDRPTEEPFKNEEPLFDSNAEQFSEEEDPFEELDNQYHVVVDHNFIENDDVSGLDKEIHSTNKSPQSFEKEIDTQIHSINNAKSPVKFFTLGSNDNVEQQKISYEIKKELEESPDFAKENSTPLINSSSNESRLEHKNQNQENAPQLKKSEKETERSENPCIIKTSSPTNTRKRSIDQRPSHRKEKRKKSESSLPDKQILNKNIIINVNDCAGKSTQKCHDAPKSVFNLFFSKNESDKEMLKDNKKTDSPDKVYSEKYVKRKETPKKPKEKEAEPTKKRTSSSSHSIVSPKDNNVISQSSSKIDPKTKLKTIDMFMEQPKKTSIHQAHRNTAAPSPSQTTKDIKTKPLQIVIRKPTEKPAVTLETKKTHTKETQTFESKVLTSRFCQTERRKLSAKFVQTDPVSFAKAASKATDAFERMKEIDLEIQVLLQEKFKLYSSLEAKDSCPSSMPTLGMTVLNVTPYNENKEADGNDVDNIMSADAIVDDFTNIPVEELEQIALETVQENTGISNGDKKSLRQKVIQRERKSSENPTCTRRGNRKAKTPNISLIEQIITDDRPLEDIISLDAFEEPPVKIKRKSQRTQQKKKPAKKTKAAKQNDIHCYILKECSVVLMRIDISKYIRNPDQSQEPKQIPDRIEVMPEVAEVEISVAENVPMVEHEVDIKPDPSELVEAVLNDLQFDMLDVSEDIVIGDNCEIKCTEDKDIHEPVTISEEIILDNSQSSSEDVFTSEGGQIENECKTYDYSTDENLRRDSVTVTGNADAVLAIECVENDFIAACLDGNVYHFSDDGQLLNTLRGSNLAVTCLTIVKEKYGTTVYTGSLDSRIRYYDLETGLEKGPECNVLSPIQTMDRAWDTIFVGTRTGFVLQFECKNNMLIPVSTVKFSEQSILALRAMKEGPRKVLLVAARSENVTIKDAQTGLLLRTLVGPKMTVYTLLFEDGKVYCGTSSHQIHVFDYASGSHTGCHEGGKGAVCLRATGGLVFAGCYDGCVYVFREGEPRPLAQLRGPSLMLLSLAIVGSKIIAGYKDRSLYIWKIPLSILQEMIL